MMHATHTPLVPLVVSRMLDPPNELSAHASSKLNLNTANFTKKCNSLQTVCFNVLAKNRDFSMICINSGYKICLLNVWM